MDNDAFKNRIKEVLSEELTQDEIFWWISFADSKPIGFLGAVIMKAHGVTDALMKCNLLGINPGGEVFCVAIPEEKYDMCTDDVVNRLISKEEMEKLWGTMTLEEWDQQQENS